MPSGLDLLWLTSIASRLSPAMQRRAGVSEEAAVTTKPPGHQGQVPLRGQPRYRDPRARQVPEGLTRRPGRILCVLARPVQRHPLATTSPGEHCADAPMAALLVRSLQRLSGRRWGARPANTTGCGSPIRSGTSLTTGTGCQRAGRSAAKIADTVPTGPARADLVYIPVSRRHIGARIL